MMKKIGKWLLNILKTIWYMIPKYVLYIVVLAFAGLGITKLFTQDPYYSQLVFVVILFGLILSLILYVGIRNGIRRIKKIKK